MCMGEYILCHVRHMTPFSHNSPNSVTPSGDCWWTHCHSVDRVSPVNPHKCTVDEDVLSRNHPDDIRTTHMTRESGTHEYCRVVSICWVPSSLSTCPQRACSYITCIEYRILYDRMYIYLYIYTCIYVYMYKIVCISLIYVHIYSYK